MQQIELHAAAQRKETCTLGSAAHGLLPPRALSSVSAGLLPVRSMFLTRNTRLLVVRATCRISLLWRANVIGAVFECVATFCLLVHVDVDRGRARSALRRQLGVARLEILRLVDFVEMLLKKTDVLAVGLDGSIGKVANEGHETNEEVDGHVDHHHDQDARWEAALDLPHVADQVERHGGIRSVTDGGDETDDGRPSEAHTKEAEQSEVQSVGCLASFGEDIGFLGRNVGGNLLPDLLELSWPLRVRDLLVVRVLCACQP